MEDHDQNQELIIFSEKGKDVVLNVDYQNDNFWISQAQMSDIYGTDISGISRHIRNILKSGEVDQKSNLQKMQIANSDRPVTFYSLDIVLSVGYRVNSAKAIAFRRWATSVLKAHVTQGYSVNEKKLEQLNLVLNILGRSTTPEISGISALIADYTQALFLLDSYDRHALPDVEGTAASWQLTYDEARAFLDSLPDIKKSDLFAKERADKFKAILAQIYQGFGDMEYYPSVEEKAANLLYFVVKDHPFFDGNKRSAAALFVYFLYKNQALRNINNNTLAAIVLMVALSKPDERDNMVLLIRNFLESE